MDPELKANLEERRASEKFVLLKPKSEAHDPMSEEPDQRFDITERRLEESERRFDRLMETLIRIEDRLGTRRYRLRILP